jgi:predicted Zn-dependent protease
MNKNRLQKVFTLLFIICSYALYGQNSENEISYDYSCLDDDEDLGSTDLIGLFKDINDEFIDATAAEISKEEELNFAEQSHTEIKSKVTFIEDSRLDNLNSILKKLVREIPNPVGYDYTIYLIDDETINAYTTGSGFIYFFSGMLDFVKNDDEIAAILSHEIYHNELGHMKDFLRIKKTNNNYFGEIGDLFTNIHAGMTITFGQKDETECDLYGIDLCKKARYEICSTSELWNRMSEDEGEFNALENLFRTHPYSKKREGCARYHIKNNYHIECP